MRTVKAKPGERLSRISISLISKSSVGDAALTDVDTSNESDVRSELRERLVDIARKVEATTTHLIQSAFASLNECQKTRLT